MSKTIIQVNNLSKRYRLGENEKSETFAGQILSSLTYPVKNFKRIAKLTKFKGTEDPSEFWALKDINFEVKEGEVLGIIGKNGAGKSTLLKILSRITEPTTGEIRIDGRISALLEVGTGFHPELTGRDNIYMNGTILGMTRKEINTKFDEIVEFSGIERHIDTPVKFYSSGMKVRLGFSVAAHLEPEILVIDEVLAVGDFEFQKKCLGKMDDVSKSGRTVLFVSHNMAAVSNLCHKALVLKDGKIIFNDETEKSIEYYINNSIVRKNNKFEIIRVDENEKSFEIVDVGVFSDVNRNEVIRTGDDIEFEFIFKSNYEKYIDNLDIAIHLVDIDGKTLCTLQPGFYNQSFTRIKKEGKIICRIKKFPFHEGVYSVDIWMLINKSLKIFEKSVISFNVEKGDFFGSGRLPKDNHKVLMSLDHHWSFKQDF